MAELLFVSVDSRMKCSVSTFIPGCWLMVKKQKALGRACDAIACLVDM